MAEREKTISILQACELVGVSRRTIYNWLNAGKLKYLRTAGGSIRIFPSTLFQQGNEPKACTLEELIAKAPHV